MRGSVRPAVPIGTALAVAVAIGACRAETATLPPSSPPTETAAPVVAPSLTFVAGDQRLDAGACTDLEWASEGALRVYLDGKGVDASGRQEVCPTSSMTYTLTAALAGGDELRRQVSVAVEAVPIIPTDAPTQQPTSPMRATEAAPTPTPTAQATQPVAVEFYPDNGLYELPKDQLCTAVNWRATGVTDVQLEREGMGRVPVGAAGREEACFEGRVRYFLYYRGSDGSEQRKEMELRHQG